MRLITGFGVLAIFVIGFLCATLLVGGGKGVADASSTANALPTEGKDNGSSTEGAAQGAPAAPARKTRNVAIFLYDGVELLDFSGPGEVFSAAGRDQEAFNVYTVAAKEGPVTSQGFVSISPQYTIANCPKPDILVLPGGNSRVPRADAASMAWVRENASKAEVTLTVCTGAFILADLGILDGKRATTHWASVDRLRETTPKATVVPNSRFVDAGNVVTSAGVSAGIDGALHVVTRLLGEPAAHETARYMEYRWAGDTP